MKSFIFISELVWVLWDLNDKLCRYRFGFENKYDINVVEDKPRTLKEDELIEVGCRVRRGKAHTANSLICTT